MTRAMTALWSSPERRSERCPSCAGERPFEQPPCPDGHEPGRCPEWACVECGHAVAFGAATTDATASDATASDATAPGVAAFDAGAIGHAETTRPARQLVTAAA
ncbi:hypothetical protein FAF44_31880 [Nonomuraea sp. MG754425]|nr:hypothetical protein [Nonomuraea sp. MG754425]